MSTKNAFTRTPKEFADFLEAHPLVTKTLIDCWDPIHRIFGDVKVHMNLEEDPTDCTTQVHVDIQWPYAMEDGRERLKQFDEEWWLDRVRDVAGDLMFDIELVEPGGAT